MLRYLYVVLLLGMGACVMADEELRTVTVNGIGFAEVQPDRASIQLSIVARESTLPAAQKVAADVTNSVLKMTDRMGLDRDRVDTTRASVRPDYRWNREKEEQELRGYIAERQITVKLDDLEKLGSVIEGAVDAGVNQVSPPQLESSKGRETYRRALHAAAEDARANASQLVSTLDARLGRVISINSGSSQQVPVPRTAGAKVMAAQSEAVQSYNAADLTFEATVTVIFELTD